MNLNEAFRKGIVSMVLINLWRVGLDPCPLKSARLRSVCQIISLIVLLCFDVAVYYVVHTVFPDLHPAYSLSAFGLVSLASIVGVWIISRLVGPIEAKFISDVEALAAIRHDVAARGEQELKYIAKDILKEYATEILAYCEATIKMDGDKGIQCVEGVWGRAERFSDTQAVFCKFSLVKKDKGASIFDEVREEMAKKREEDERKKKEEETNRDPEGDDPQTTSPAQSTLAEQ